MDYIYALISKIKTILEIEYKGTNQEYHNSRKTINRTGVLMDRSSVKSITDH